MNETPFFFGTAPSRRFAVFHAAEIAAPALPFVFCHPFGEEKLWAHRVYVTFARALAAAGHPALRFDYTGNGDSDGAFRHSTLRSAEADIEAAIDELKGRTGATRVGLIGLRLGASLASVVAERRADVDRLILWAPIVAGAAYLQELLRINLTTQLAVYREVREDREALGRRLAASQTVNVDGYDIGPAMAEQMQALSLKGGPSSYRGPCLIAQLERNPAAPPAKDLEEVRRRYPQGELNVVQEEPFWKEINRFYDTASNLFAATTQWLDGGPAEAAR